MPDAPRESRSAGEALRNPNMLPPGWGFEDVPFYYSALSVSGMRVTASTRDEVLTATWAIYRSANDA